MRRTELDIINLTAADRAIDELIEKRAAERAAADREAEAQGLMINNYNSRTRSDNRAALYRAQIRSAEAARERAAERLARLIDGGA